MQLIGCCDKYYYISNQRRLKLKFLQFYTIKYQDLILDSEVKNYLQILVYKKRFIIYIYKITETLG